MGLGDFKSPIQMPDRCGGDRHHPQQVPYFWQITEATRRVIRYLVRNNMVISRRTDVRLVSLRWRGVIQRRTLYNRLT